MRSKELNTPVLFLIFNRLDTAKLVFEQIKLAKPRHLYIASDGPRKDKYREDQVVSETREWVVKNVTWDCDIKTLFRESNLGCGKAVSSAIDWFFENEEMGIILEDDCLPDLTFFHYCEDLLNRYKDNSRVMSICAPNMIHYAGNVETSYSFSKYCLVWGWATWRRAWVNYDFEMKDWPSLRESSWLSQIESSYRFRLYWTYVFDLCYQRKLDTWDYQWINACWRQGGLAIVPSVNMVSNIGIGNNSTHVVDKRFSQFKAEPMIFPLRHPNEIEISLEFEAALRRQIFTVSSIDYLKIFLQQSIILKILRKSLRLYGF